ncbi:MAG: serine hydrolase [Candidatus Glassbacteria bacterium]
MSFHRTSRLIKTLVFLSAALLPAARLSLAAEPVLNADAFHEITQIISERVDKFKACPGIVVGVINSRGSEVIGWGTLDSQDDRVPDGRTVFEIGSASKVFTALLLADMTGHGEVAFEDLIAKFLPESVKTPSYDGKEIELVQLATHTSGLPRMPDNFDPADPDNPYADYSVKQMYDFLAKYKLTGEPGSVFAYSNFGMGLLGHILALKAGVDYETLLVKRICEPLKMNDTRITLTSEMTERLATGHNRAGEPLKNWDIPTLAGAGAIRSTAADLLKFLAAHLGLAETGLSAAMERTQTPWKENEVYKQVGLGWMISDKFDIEILWHNGQTGGYHCFIGFIPQKKIGVAVLANSDQNIDDIGFHLLDERYELARLESPSQEIELSEQVLQKYVGKYEISPGLVFTVTIANGKLMIQLTGQEAVQIFPSSETEFFCKVVDARITFGLDDKGKVSHLVLRQSGGEVTAVREGSDYRPASRGREITLGPEKLKKYAGTYELQPGVNFSVSVEGGKLMVQLTGQAGLQVFPESENEFFYKAVDARLTFQVDDKGEVTGLILHQAGRDVPARKIK